MRLIRFLVPFIAFCVILWAVYFIGGWFFVQYQIRQAKAQMLVGRHQEALETLARANRFRSSDAELHFQLAIVYRRLSDVEGFRTHLKRAQELGFAKTREVERQELLWSAQSGNIKLVEAELREMISEDGISNDTADQIFEAMSKGYMSVYQMEDAFDCLSFWVQNDWAKDSVWPKRWMAELNVRSRNLNEARLRYQEIVEMVPDNVEVCVAYANLLLETNSVEESLDLLQKCLEFHPGNKDLQVPLMECYYRKPDLEKTEELANSILQGRPTKAQRGAALTQLGKIFTRNGQSQQAVEYLLQANELMPTHADPVYALSEAYRFLGEKEKASFYLEKSKRLSELRLQVLALSLQLNESPGDVAKMFEMAEMLLELGEDNESAAWLKIILNLNNRHIPSMLALARFYHKQGRSDLADAYIRTARNVQEKLDKTSQSAPRPTPPESAGGKAK